MELVSQVQIADYMDAIRAEMYKMVLEMPFSVAHPVSPSWFGCQRRHTVTVVVVSEKSRQWFLSIQPQEHANFW